MFFAFISKGALSKSIIIKFANSMGIATGIVVGQLQHKGLLSIKYSNELKQRLN